MPAVSQNQLVAMRIAKSHPEDLYPKNKGLASMSQGQLEDFVHTPSKGLPKKVGLHNIAKAKGKPNV